MRVIIVAGGELGDPHFYRELVSPADYIIAVNGGSAHALRIGLVPDLLIGDLDSLDQSLREKVLALSKKVEEHPSEKDKSDLELAIDRAVALGACEVLIFGALGGPRVDHALINLLLLQRLLEQGVGAKIVDPGSEVSLLQGGQELTVIGCPGDLVSLFSLRGSAESVRTAGLKYGLDCEDLLFASTRGLSNELLETEARIALGKGLLMVIKSTGG